MCEPMTIMAVSGLAMSGVSSMMGAKATAANARQNASQLKTQSLVMEQQERLTKEQGEYQKRAISEEFRQGIGQGKTSFGARGVAVSSEAVSSWETDVNAQAKAEREAVDYQTRIAIWKSDVEQDSMLRSAKSYEKSAKSAEKWGLFGGLAQLGTAGVAGGMAASGSAAGGAGSMGASKQAFSSSQTSSIVPR